MRVTRLFPILELDGHGTEAMKVTCCSPSSSEAAWPRALLTRGCAVRRPGEANLPRAHELISSRPPRGRSSGESAVCPSSTPLAANASSSDRLLPCCSPPNPLLPLLFLPDPASSASASSAATASRLSLVSGSLVGPWAGLAHWMCHAHPAGPA